MRRTIAILVLTTFLGTTSSVAQERAPQRGALVELSFNDAPLTEVIRYVAQVTGRRFILTRDLSSLRVTVVSPRPIRRAEVYSVFLSVLSSHSLTVVRSGRYHRIVPLDGVERRNTPVVPDGARGASGEQFVLRMHRVPEGALDNAIALLEQFRSPAGTITADPRTSTLILHDTGANVRRMLAILDRLHAPAEPERIYIVPVEHHDARELAKTVRAVRGAR